MRPNPIRIAYRLVLDVSGSMSGQRIADVRDALVKYVNDYLAFPQNAVGVTTFATTVAEVMPWTPIRDACRLMPEVARRLSTGGSTAMATGLGVGLSSFRQLAGQGFLKSVILLSDGESTEPNEEVLAQIPLAQQHRIRISTINFGGGASEKLLQSLALRTRGKYFTAYNYQQLWQAFKAA